MLGLVKLLETDSKESQSLEKDKGALTPAVIYNPIPAPLPHEQSSEPSRQPYFPLSSQPRFPHSYDTPDSKRKISETSFGTRSTETTPIKLVHPEANVQSLQNKFVDAIIEELWSGGIDVPWVQGRHMFLDYAEFRRFILSLS